MTVSAQTAAAAAASKVCTGCKQDKPLEAFSVSRLGKHGRAAMCKPCRRERYAASKAAWRKVYNQENHDRVLAWKREWRRWNPEAAYNPAKRAAHVAVREALAKGVISRPDNCERCGDANRLYGHHEDYSRQIDVVWLCAPCHGKRHAELRREAETQAEAA